MSLATLTTRDLVRIQRLVERKEALAEQIAGIDQQLEAIDSGAAVSKPTAEQRGSTKADGALPVTTPPKKGKAGRRGRGALKERVSKELQAAGAQGLKVGELATRLGTSYSNVSVFFHSTAKKIREIRKVGVAQYAWKA